MNLEWGNRWRPIVGGVLALSTLLLGACSREANPAIEEAACSLPCQPLRWIGHWKGEGRREQLVKEVLEEFSFLHPELDVQFAFAADILPEKSQKAMAHLIADMIGSGKIVWDVVWLDPLVYRLVAEELDDWSWGKKHLVDFSGVPGFAKTQKPFLVDGPEAHRYTGGVLPGPYIEGFFYAAWYNKAVADRLGIEIREEGMTYADLLGYVQRIHAYNQQAEVPVTAFLDFKGAGAVRRLIYSLFFSQFKTDALEAASPEELHAATDQVASLFEELGRYSPLANDGSTHSWADAAQVLMDDRALFFFDATWRYNAFEQFDPVGINKLRLAQMPGVEAASYMIGGYISTWAVLKDAPGRDAGIALLQYWSQPSVAERWVRYTKCPTGLRGNLYDPQYGRDAFADFQRRMCARYERPLMDPLMVVGEGGRDVHQKLQDMETLLRTHIFAKEGYDALSNE